VHACSLLIPMMQHRKRTLGFLNWPNRLTYVFPVHSCHVLILPGRLLQAKYAQPRVLWKWASRKEDASCWYEYSINPFKSWARMSHKGRPTCYSGCIATVERSGWPTYHKVVRIEIGNYIALLQPRQGDRGSSSMEAQFVPSCLSESKWCLPVATESSRVFILTYLRRLLLCNWMDDPS
jgi:hypothetical protein